MSNTFDLVDFSKYNKVINNKKDRVDYSGCFELESDKDDELYYQNLHQCKDIIDENMDKIIKKFPQVKESLDPHNNNFTKSMINDGLSTREAYAMGFLFTLMIVSSLSKN